MHSPVPLNPNPGDPIGLKRSQEATILLGSSSVAAATEPWGPCGSAGEQRLGTATYLPVLSQGQSSDPPPARAGWQQLSCALLPGEGGRALVRLQVGEARRGGQDATLLLHVELRRGQSAARLVLIAADGELRRQQP